MNRESQGLADGNGAIKVRLHTKQDAARLDMPDGVALLSAAYNSLYAWDTIVSQAELDSTITDHSRQRPKKELSSYQATVPAEDELRVGATGGSPAVVKITGAPGPLNRLQCYLANRHVDWDREAKEPSEDRRLELEKQRTDTVREQVESLRGMGFPEIQIREALSRYIFGPLDRLERFTTVEFLSDSHGRPTERFPG